MKNYIFHISGMHCKTCVILIESALNEIPEVIKAKVSFERFEVEITADFGNKEPAQIVNYLNTALKPHGYSLSLEKQKHLAQWSDFSTAAPSALLFIGLFIFLQKLGIVNLINVSKVSYGTAFIIGLIASISSCMAVVGGLVLSASANLAKQGEKVRPQILFHIGRLISFFILGGLIGIIGASFELGAAGSFILTSLVAIILLILGINLLDVFPWFKKIQLTLPKFLGRRVHEIKNVNHTLTPLILGVATFFLPCGFTQAMQIYSLSTGSFWLGALTMFSFALGTLPVLSLLSFSSLSIRDKSKAGIFFKAAGLIVIFFALFNIINGLVAFGLIPPIFNF